VDVRGWKAIGSKLNYPKLVDASFIETDVIDPEADVQDKVTPNIPSGEKEILPEEIENGEEIENSVNELEDIIPDIEPVKVSISIENNEIDPINQIQEDIPLIIKNSTIPESDANKADDIPFEIKNIAPENLPKEKGKGEQLGLF
jgi:hypothetical protein